MLYHLGRFLFSCYFRLFFRWRILGRENIPPSGPFIICSNHINILDPPLVGCSIPSRLHVHFMAKQELFRNKFFGAVLRRVGAYPVDRDGVGYAAVRTSFRLLSEGKVICLFPEGTRSKDGVVQRAHPGAAMIAAHCLAPVLPVAITGPYLFGKPLQVSVGPAFHLPSPEGGDRKQNIKVSSELIMSRIKELIIQDQEIHQGKQDGCPGRCGE